VLAYILHEHNNMTTIINLFGGPGSGKSTTAAYLYAGLKNQGVNAELIREYVKDWAYESRTVGVFDQLYFFGKQVRRETFSLGTCWHSLR
jgi:ABC-type multidrug transport system ATPase subunit